MSCLKTMWMTWAKEEEGSSLKKKFSLFNGLKIWHLGCILKKQKSYQLSIFRLKSWSFELHIFMECLVIWNVAKKKTNPTTHAFFFLILFYFIVHKRVIFKIKFTQRWNHLLFLNLYPRIHFTDFRERGREREREWGKHQCERKTSSGCLPMLPDWELNLQPRYVPW